MLARQAVERSELMAAAVAGLKLYIDDTSRMMGHEASYLMAFNGYFNGF